MNIFYKTLIYSRSICHLLFLSYLIYLCFRMDTLFIELVSSYFLIIIYKHIMRVCLLSKVEFINITAFFETFNTSCDDYVIELLLLFLSFNLFSLIY